MRRSPSRLPRATTPRRKRPSAAVIIVGAVVTALIVALSAATSGASGALNALGVVALLTAVYAFVTGRRSWAALPSRRGAAAAVGVSLVLLIVGGSVGQAATKGDEPAIAGASKPAAAATGDGTSGGSANDSDTDTATDTASGNADAAATGNAAGNATGDSTTSDGTTSTANPASTDDTTTTAGTTTAPVTAALALLAALPVKGKAPATGYQRVADFGTAWTDVDHNGCDTRNDILRRDLTATTFQGSCKVLTGTLHSPYTGAAISFVRGVDTSTLVQIDHVVALENAWQTGAQQLSQTDRMALANDPTNLFAVDQHSNEQKGSGDAATWLPAAKTFRCTYISHQVTVKARYHLWVTSAEHDAMARVLSSCPAQTASGSGGLNTTTDSATATADAAARDRAARAAAATQAAADARAAQAAAAAREAAAAQAAAEAAAAAQPPAAPAAVYYPNCAAARAAGATPIRAGEPGYSRKLDRDGDGVACE